MSRLVQPPEELVRFWHEKYEQDLRVRRHETAGVISIGGCSLSYYDG
jgi:hypothetical protein